MGNRMDGTPWTEYQWQDPEIKRRFEAGELGYREARQLDRAASTEPSVFDVAVSKLKDLKTQSDTVQAGRKAAERDVGASALAASEARLAAAEAAVPQKSAQRADRARALDELNLRAQTPAGPIAGGTSIRSGQELGNLFSTLKAAIATPTAPAAESDQPGEMPPTEAPPADRMAATKMTAEARVPGGAPSTKLPKDLATAPEAWSEPAPGQFALQLPDGTTETHTAAEWNAILAYKRSQDIAAAEAKYAKATDSARSGALWAELIRGVSALGIAAYGIKHGTDMSGFKLEPIDWASQQEAARRGHETSLETIKQRYGEYTTAVDAWRKDDAETRARKFQAATQALQRYNALTDTFYRGVQAQQDNARLALERYRTQSEVAAKNSKVAGVPKEVQDLVKSRDEAFLKLTTTKDLSDDQRKLLLAGIRQMDEQLRANPSGAAYAFQDAQGESPWGEVETGWIFKSKRAPTEREVAERLQAGGAAPAAGTRVRHKATGIVRALSNSELRELRAKPTANEFEVLP